MEADGDTDADLLVRVAAGEKGALSIVFDRHAKSVTRYAWALAPNRMDVEEIVQDTFLTMWRKAARITIPEESLLPWLLVTCRYLAQNLVRKASRNRADALPDENTGDFLELQGRRQDAETARDDLRWVLEEIERLDPIDRRVCELCLIEGVPYAQAARQLGLSVGAVKQRVSRSRVRLRKAVTVDEN